jgi:hypothetical protein
MLRVKDTNTVPPGYFRYRDPDSKTLLKAPYYSTLRKQAREHRLANNLPIGLLWKDEFDAAVCREQPEICYETTAEKDMTAAEKATHFISSMANWVKSGFAVLPQVEYEARRAICRGTDGHERCPQWRGENKKKFIACGKCGCTKLKLFLPHEHCPLGKW